MGSNAAVWRNWSGAVEARPRITLRPSTEEEIAALVQREAGPIRTAGSGHSFTPLVETSGVLLSLDNLSGIKRHDASAQTVTLGAGTKIHAIGRPLYVLGFGLKNQGDIDRQSLAGALSTGTHGTGLDLPCLSAEVASFRIVTGRGEVLNCSPTENADVFAGGRVSFGALGILTEVTMRVRPRYRLKETHWTMGAEEALRNLDRYAAAHRHFEFFWFPFADDVAAKALDETDEPAPEPGSSADMERRGEVVTSDQRAFQAGCEIARYIPAVNPLLHRLFTKGVAGKPRIRWSHEAFPSPRTVRFNEMEYAVPAGAAGDCLKEIVSAIRRGPIQTTFPIEFRFVKADDIWMSPFYLRDSATISIHQYAKEEFAPLFDACEAVFRRFDGRPHWGKRHQLGASAFNKAYPKFDDFCSIVHRCDPEGRLANAHVRTILGRS